MVPFYIVEQSSRACLCVYCYKAKLLTAALFDLWPTLHQGETPGSKCTCTCELCKDGKCVDYLPYKNRQAVYSMGNFNDGHMCAKEFLYTSKDGTRVEAHRATCVTGNCPDCKRKQDIFFDCPMHKGGAQRPLFTSVSTSSNDSSGGQHGTPSGEVSWNMFTEVDERGNPTTTRNTDVDDDEDGEYLPQGGPKKRRQVCVWHIYVYEACRDGVAMLRRTCV